MSCSSTLDQKEKEKEINHNGKLMEDFAMILFNKKEEIWQKKYWKERSTRNPPRDTNKNQKWVGKTKQEPRDTNKNPKWVGKTKQQPTTEHSASSRNSLSNNPYVNLLFMPWYIMFKPTH